MALTLGLKKGQSFYVVSDSGEEFRFRLSRVLGVNDFVLESESGDTYRVTSALSVEILPDVRVFAGDTHELGLARVAIEAPLHIKINRFPGVGH